MDMEILAYAQNEGFDAYNENRPGAPALSLTVLTLLGDAPVGGIGAQLFQAFTDGFNMAADVACARILA